MRRLLMVVAVAALGCGTVFTAGGEVGDGGSDARADIDAASVIDASADASADALSVGDAASIVEEASTACTTTECAASRVGDCCCIRNIGSACENAYDCFRAGTPSPGACASN